MCKLSCILVILIFPVFLIGYSCFASNETLNYIDKLGLKQGRWKISWNDMDTLKFCRLDQFKGFQQHMLFEEGEFKNGKKTGIWIQYYPSGRIHWKVQFKNGAADGIYECFYESGMLQETGLWKENKQRGQNFGYYENGNLEWEGCHDPEAKLIGYSIKYFPNGIVKEIAYRYKGKLEGYTLLYDSCGNEISRKFYQAGVEIVDSVNNIVDFEALQDLVRNKNRIVSEKQRLVNLEIEKEVSKVEQNRKEERYRNEKLQQKIITYSMSFFTLLITVFAFFAYRNYQQKHRINVVITNQKKEVELQKQIIEEKNKDITDSLNYAKRIQQARLPVNEEILEALPQSFVLFKPKDIVSGDFYYFRKKDKKVFLAAADCTGHGVPGAFMSIIGSEKLDEAVSQTSDTSEILKLLNKGIKSSLKQSDDADSTRDGMDIALCLIDLERKRVKYSGANRPIWIIRKGQTEVEEIRATKTAIGGLTEDNQQFETHELLLKQGDSFFIFSDGFADTFSSQNKKITTKRLKNILLEIQDKYMKEQELHLETYLDDWKAGTEQVDDILVIGVRL